MTTQPTILVVDDEPDNFDVIETLLDHEGYQLTYASDGKQALKLLQAFQPDVILLDVMMPNMSGIAFCQHFKANPLWRHIPVIMVTALTSKEDLAQCLSVGADDFISKPVSGLELRARVRSMLRIKQQYDNLQNLLQLQEDMTNMVVHDLRNPLATILLATEMLQYLNYPAEKQQIKIKQIATAGKELQVLIDSLLLIAKLEAGKLTPNYTDINIIALCTSAIQGFEAIAAQKSLEIISRFPEQQSIVQADVILLRRVIDNLLSNAIKFSPRNSQIILSVEHPEGSGIRLRVADFGPGVSEDLRESIFEKYEIGTLIRSASQTGLGLAFCKIAIEAHKGKIKIESNQPKGSVFVVDIG